MSNFNDQLFFSPPSGWCFSFFGTLGTLVILEEKKLFIIFCQILMDYCITFGIIFVLLFRRLMSQLMWRELWQFGTVHVINLVSLVWSTMHSALSQTFYFTVEAVRRNTDLPPRPFLGWVPPYKMADWEFNQWTDEPAIAALASVIFSSTIVSSSG